MIHLTITFKYLNNESQFHKFHAEAMSDTQNIENKKIIDFFKKNDMGKGLPKYFQQEIHRQENLSVHHAYNTKMSDLE